MKRRLKDWIKSYLEFTESSESPEVFHFWVAVSTLGGALRRRVWIDQRHFEWTPNFYIIFVAPAGIVSKSTTIGIGVNLLREIEDIKFGPDSGTWQAIGKSLMDAVELVPTDPQNLESIMESMSCITCAPGELGTFIDFNDRKLIDTLTSLWDGQRGVFEHRTATAGIISIENPWINLISATTPAWLRRNVPEEAIGAGLASRIIFVFGEKKRRLIPYPGLVGNDKVFDALREDLVFDLKLVASMYGEMVLTPEAVAWGTDWYENHWENRPVHMASARYDSYLARKQTHTHKLAMVISASKSSDCIIDVEHLKAAERIMSATEHDMIKVFESIGVAPMSRLMQEVINFLHNYQKQGLAVTQQMLYRHCFQTMSQQEFEEAVNASIKAGYVELKQGRDGKLYYFLKVDPNNMGANDADAQTN